MVRGRPNMFEKGKLFSDVPLVDAAGASLRLWDLRNKTHAAFFVFPAGKAAELKEKFGQAAGHQKTWDWLAVKFFGMDGADDGFDPGVYLIDRFGGFINYWPYSADMWEKIEKDYLYYEARHC